MKNWITRWLTRLRVLFLPIFSIFLCLSVTSQTLQENLIFADSMFRAKKFDVACKEYQRCLYFAPDSTYFQLYNKLADCFVETKEFERAIQHLNLAYNVALCDSSKHEIVLRKSLCYTQLKQFQLSNKELLVLEDSLLSKNFFHRKQFYLGVNFYGLCEFELAKNCFLKAVNDSDTVEKQAIISIFAKKRNFRSPNPTAAFYMSLAIPGLGQLYSGNVKDAIHSILLTWSLLALGVTITQTYTFWDAFFAVGPWFQRYYQGGCINAERLATERREEKRFKTFQRILTLFTK